MSSRLAAKPIDLQIHAKVGGAFVPTLGRQLHRALRLMRTQLKQVSIALVGDALMSKLHVQFMHVAGPTDVLTFELEHDAKGRVTEGEIVVCVPEARRQAREHGTKVEHELLLYAIHGLLHLSGYDDRTEAGFRAIHREEDRILVALRVGPVFAPKGTPTPRTAASKSRGAGRKVGRKKDGRSR
jgi:probable rRNA maturation factor